MSGELFMILINAVSIIIILLASEFKSIDVDSFVLFMIATINGLLLQEKSLNFETQLEYLKQSQMEILKED